MRTSSIANGPGAFSDPDQYGPDEGNPGGGQLNQATGQSSDGVCANISPIDKKSANKPGILDYETYIDDSKFMFLTNKVFSLDLLFFDEM